MSTIYHRLPAVRRPSVIHTADEERSPCIYPEAIALKYHVWGDRVLLLS